VKPRKKATQAQDPVPHKQKPLEHGRKHYLIQVERPGERLSISDVRKIFAATGVELDSQYGPILINPDLGRHAVRGWADDQSRQSAERIPGVRFFSDPRIAPLSAPGV
jgi:hypothetical protein